MQAFHCILCIILLTAPVFSEESVQLVRSRYFDQHVTIIDRVDHHLVHFNVQVRRDEPDGGSLMHASIAMKHADDRGEWGRLTFLQETVPIKDRLEKWSFYFRVPKHLMSNSKTLIGLKVRADGVQPGAYAVFELENKTVNLGSKDMPLTFPETVSREIPEESPGGTFKFKVVYETREFSNNYNELPIVGFLLQGKSGPQQADAARMARRLGNDD